MANVIPDTENIRVAAIAAALQLEAATSTGNPPLKSRLKAFLDALDVIMQATVEGKGGVDEARARLEKMK